MEHLKEKKLPIWNKLPISILVMFILYMAIDIFIIEISFLEYLYLEILFSISRKMLNLATENII